MSNVSVTYQPKIVAYWLGWVGEDAQAFPALEGLPAYLDTLIVAFAVVQKGGIQTEVVSVPVPSGSSTCPGCQRSPCPATCLIDQAVQPPRKLAQLMEWVGGAKDHNQNLKVLLSIGGDRYCDWASVTSADAFAESVRKELAKWNGKRQLLDGVDIDYEDQTCCGSSLGSGITIVELIQRVAEVVPAGGILSVPLYSGTPSGLTDNLSALKPYVTFATTMEYASCVCDPHAGGSFTYQGTAKNVNWLALGFSTDFQVAIPACIDSGKGAVTAGMVWHLGNKDHSKEFLCQLNWKLNSGPPCTPAGSRK